MRGHLAQESISSVQLKLVRCQLLSAPTTIEHGGARVVFSTITAWMDPIQLPRAQAAPFRPARLHVQLTPTTDLELLILKAKS